MFARSLGFAFAIGAAMLTTGAADAAVLYTSEAAWAAAVGGQITNTTTDPTLTAAEADPSVDREISIITLDDGTVLTPQTTFEVGRANSADWHTWSNGYNGAIYSSDFALTGTVDVSPVAGLGFEIEPGLEGSSFDVTLTLNDGAVLTQNVSGSAGALFFGWVGDVTSFTISVPRGSLGFAFGNIFSAVVTPEPASLALLGAGLAGMGAMRRRKKA